MDTSKSVPWQVDWKRPRWNQIIGNASEQIVGPSSSQHQDHAIIVGSASAEIDPNEVPSLALHASSSSSTTTTTSLIMSVTLLSRQSASQIIQTDHPVASELLLELHECPATAQDASDTLDNINNNSTNSSQPDETNSSKLLASKRLQWPEAILDDAAHQEESLASATDASNASKMSDWLTLAPLLKLNQKAEQSFLGNNPNGLLSAVLIRKPQNARKDDVLDTIALMSLGMGKSSSPTTPLKQETTTNDDSTVAKEQEETKNDQDKETPLPELYLACMTVRGLVAIYSPWTLLQLENKAASASSVTPSTTKTPDVQLADSLATLFLGQEIFSALEQAWKPLSEPLSTISLSILEQNQIYKKRGKRKRALDVSLWNHLVESATIPHRTVANRATNLQVAGPSYLAVFGSGIPYTQVFRHDDESTVGGDAASRHHQSIVEEEDYEDDEEEHGHHDHHRDDWWDQEHQEETQPINEVAFLRPRIDSNGSDLWLNNQEEDGSETKVELISGPIQEWIRKDSSGSQEDGRTASGKDEGKGKNKLNKWWQRIRKTSSADDSEDLPLKLSTGGFITFCSISLWSETRTLFLPFVPKQISYIPEWNSMEIVLVMGETQAIAVRLDSSQAPVVIGNVTDQLQQSIVEKESDMDESVGAQTPVKKNENYMNIERFQVLPIALPQQSTITSRILCGSAPGVQPPALLQLFTEEIHHGLVLQKSLKGITALGTIELSHAPSDIAKIQVGEHESLSTSWSVLGQGWSLLGTSENVYFICWEGATVAGGVALVHVLTDSPLLTAAHPTCVDFVSPSRRYIADRVNETDAKTGDSKGIVELEDVNYKGLEEEEDDGIDRIVIQAMESVSGLSSRAQIDDDDDDDAIAPETSFISSEERHRQKSVRLLSRMSSWTRLEHTLDKMDRQVHIVSLRSGNAHAPKYTFTLRQVFVENGATSSFHQVLSWLADRGDYFTASSIALNLLQDAETLYHLWRSADKIDSIEEQNKLEGLLDGIEPVEEFDENDGPSPAMVQLADMTVGCLAKGGLEMSSTLEKFLRENKLYDPSIACLMLVSTTSKALSDYYEETTPTASVDDLLWPVRSLLEAGVARDCLPTVLVLLNSAIPDELRGREQKKGMPMIGVTRALVSTIVAADKSSPELLLNLTEGTSKQKYWESLDHDTQLALSLTFVAGKYPLLNHQEIRSWARERLHSRIASVPSNGTQDIPSAWLQKLVSACLANASCNQEEFATESEENSSAFEDSVNQRRLEILKFRKAMDPISGIPGVDFDLLIPCLLVLQQRGISWNGEGFAPTQSLLDAACHVAGRHSPDLFAFAFDSSTVMKECALAGNVRAAANLIGGANGFVLQCSDILIQHLGMAMNDAETFFLNDALSTDFLKSAGGKNNFQLGEAHRDLLLLLDENILTIQTYGEFDTVHIRGRVDPVFSSRSILRAWLCLSYGDKDASVDWLVKYLRKRLKLEEEERSPYRLPCAALCRSLFWSESGSTSDSLSVQMGIDMTFLVQLALSCCGLVESIPQSIAKEVSAKVEAPKMYSMPSVQFPSASRLN